ncbi:hypothetical protein Ciccas_000700 [Cichlidogyrus casuarinus]|uniref:Uncharacterized protein n=1 Tax=Cichlidogyrus casuarinus TaxID=1844966 RepID=A0ABD2QM70_9PLAT
MHRSFTEDCMIPTMAPASLNIIDSVVDSILQNKQLSETIKSMIELLSLADYFCFINDLTVVEKVDLCA